MSPVLEVDNLTVGYGIVLWHILAITLQIHAGLPWPVAVVLVILAGAAFGWFNGFLVEIARIDSFIATLGTGTVIYAVALWYTGGRQMIGALPPSFFLVNSGSILGMPITAFYVLVIALLLWIVTEYLPIGRYLYAIGANPRAAELNGLGAPALVVDLRSRHVTADEAAARLDAVLAVITPSMAVPQSRWLTGSIRAASPVSNRARRSIKAVMPGAFGREPAWPPPPGLPRPGPGHLRSGDRRGAGGDPVRRVVAIRPQAGPAPPTGSAADRACPI